MKPIDQPQRRGVPSQGMNNPAPQRFTGNGPPRRDLGREGDKYTDNASGQFYAKRATGWTNRSQITFCPTLKQKRRWVQTAQDASLSLEDWITRTLDKATGRIQ